MSKLQEVFLRIQKTKKEQKKIKDIYKDALLNSKEYQSVIEELKILKEKKKDIEDKIKNEFGNEFDKLEILKQDIKNDLMIMSDLALNKIVKGENIKIKDNFNNNYEPIFNVRFKKI